MSSVQGPTLVAPKVLEAATKQVFNTTADIAFEEKISNHGVIASVFLRIAHFFGWYGEVKGKDSLDAERKSIRQLNSASYDVITLLAKTAIIRPSDAAALGGYQAQGATPEQIKIREDLDKAIDNFYSKLQSRIVQLTGNDLSKDGVAEKHVALYQAGMLALSERIEKHNANQKNAPISPKWNQIINTHIAQNVRFDLASGITPKLILEQGPQALGRIVDQYIKLFGGSDVTAQTLVKALREEVITKYGKEFDAAAKQLGINKAPKEAVQAKHDAILAECNAAEQTLKTLSEQSKSIAEQIVADNKQLKNAKIALKDREAEFALFKKQLPKLADKTPKQMLEIVNGLNREGVDPQRLVRADNIKKCAESLLKARLLVEELQAVGSPLKTRLALLDAVSAKAEKAKKTIEEARAKLTDKNLEAIVKEETENRIKQLGYFASRDSIGSDAFVALVYPNAEAQKPAAAEAPKGVDPFLALANARRHVEFDPKVVNKNSKQFAKDIYPKRELAKIAKEGDVIETTPVELSAEELDGTFYSYTHLEDEDEVTSENLGLPSREELDSESELRNIPLLTDTEDGFEIASDEYNDPTGYVRLNNKTNSNEDAFLALAESRTAKKPASEKTPLLSVVASDEYDDEAEETSADVAKINTDIQQLKARQASFNKTFAAPVAKKEAVTAKAPATPSLFDSVDFAAPTLFDDVTGNPVVVGEGNPFVDEVAPVIADVDFLSGNGVTYAQPKAAQIDTGLTKFGGKPGRVLPF